MTNVVDRDRLSLEIDNKIKHLCSDNEKIALKEILNYLRELLKKKDLMEHHIKDIENEIDKILLYNI